MTDITRDELAFQFYLRQMWERTQRSQTFGDRAAVLKAFEAADIAIEQLNEGQK